MHSAPFEFPPPKSGADFERMCAQIYGVVAAESGSRFSGRFKRLLETAAAHENRSLTNMLETPSRHKSCRLLRNQEHGFVAESERIATEKTKKGRTSK